MDWCFICRRIPPGQSFAEGVHSSYYRHLSNILIIQNAQNDGGGYDRFKETSLSSTPLNYDGLASSAMKRSLSMEGIVDTDDFLSEEKKYEAMVYADY